jgi:mono/diheme cytochrome c family protein
MRQRRSSGIWVGLGLIALVGSFVGTAALGGPASSGTVAPAPVSPAAAALFEKQVRPLFIERCHSCHSAGTAAKNGGLRLDSREALLRGGGRGPSIVPGKPEQSLLLRAIDHSAPELRMPPSGKLASAQIAAVSAWIRAGAPWGDAAVGGGRATEPLWSLRPVRRPMPPAVRGRSWVRSPIDAFVLARLEAAGLKPAPPADRRTWIRRATFDLTGIPPTPAEIRVFLDDQSPEAFAHVVDRLLASPAYGERWGRRWLDVARYADSNGLDENLTFAHAWRYRDYVICVFNQDKPFDRFIHEQLAGDLLPDRGGRADPTEDPIVATGFLSLGAKMLAEDDPVKMEMDIIDEQVDTVGKAFLGMTLGCARCHDHKFDPISMADYYGLAGIFKSTRTMENFRVVAVWHENVLADSEEQERVAEAEKRVAAARQEVESTTRAATEALLERARGRVGAYLFAGTAALRSELKQEPRTMSESDLIPEVVRRWKEQLAAARGDGASVFAAWHRAAGTATFPAEALLGPASRALLDRPSSNLARLAARYVTRFDEARRAWLELRARQPMAASLPDGELEQFRRVLYAPDGPFAPPPMPERFYPAETRAQLGRLGAAVKAVEGAVPTLPRALGVREGTPTDLKIHLRGDYLTQGEQAPRRIPAAITPAGKVDFPTRQSGRLELARWLTSPLQPLTGRVMVNRVWLGHFGEGLVRSPDNFGRLGEKPTHPELLDWLAGQFTDAAGCNWSLKKLHRMLMLSSTYAMSSGPDPRAAGIDPENRLLWRYSRRRLDAEEVRDAIMAVSGSLDRAMGGTLLPLKNREYVTSTANRDSTDYNSPRRAVYLPVVRSSLYDLFTAFDFGDPSVLNGQRTATTVAPQALFMMNGSIVLRQTRKLAEGLARAPAAEERAALASLVERCYGRPAESRELDRLLRFRDRIESATSGDPGEREERRIRAWQSVCRVLLAANEFMYVD